MMDKLKDLQKQLLSLWKTIEIRILESHSFKLLKEKYQSLNIGQQKLIKFLFVFLLLAALLYFPVSYFVSSNSYWSEFKEKQEISLELLKMRNKISSSVFHNTKEQLKDKIRVTAKKYTTFDFEIKDKRQVFPKGDSVYQIDFDVQINHLNVRQTVQLGTELHNLPQSRLSSIVLKENKEYTKHYDVDYKITSFVSKMEKAKFRPEKRKRSSRKRKRPAEEKKKDTPFLEEKKRDTPFLKEKEKESTKEVNKSSFNFQLYDSSFPRKRESMQNRIDIKSKT